MALSKKATLEITDTFDRIAGLLSQDHEALGVPARVASDLVTRLDTVSDYLCKQAGISIPVKGASASNGGEDPEQIGQTEGPEKHDSDEGSYMQHFDQGENRELQEKVEGGGLGKGASLLGKLASLEGLSDADFRALAARLAEEEGDDDEKEAGKKASFAHGFDLTASDDDEYSDEE